MNGRSIIEVDPIQANMVQRIFELYAYGHKTIDGVREALVNEGLYYSDTQHRFTRSKIHSMLRDRAYLGEVRYKSNWYPGVHDHLIRIDVWDRVQAMPGDRVYQQNELTYAGGLITCGHCGNPITGEVKRKQTKKSTSITVAHGIRVRVILECGYGSAILTRRFTPYSIP